MTTSRSRSRKRSFPVTVTRMMQVRCAVCGRLLGHRPGEAGKVLTAHYAAEHADVLEPRRTSDDAD